jgi:hypothetical protein
MGAPLLIRDRWIRGTKRAFKVAIVKRVVALSGRGLRYRAFRSVLFHRALLPFAHGGGSDGPFDACDPYDDMVCV